MIGNTQPPTRLMRILFIHNRYKFRGGEDVAVEMEASILQNNGHATRTILFDNDEIGSAGSKLSMGIKAIYNRDSASIVENAIREFRPDLIHVHNLFFIASPSVLYNGWKNKIPVVVTLHNYRLVCANALLMRDNKICELCLPKTFPVSGIKYKCYRNSAAESALVTSVTSLHKAAGTWKNKVSKYMVLTEFAKSRFLNSTLNIRADKFVVKPNFIYDPGPGEVKRNGKYLFVGRLSVEKGAAILLQAFAEQPDLRLELVGEGPLQAELQKEFKVYPNIRFLGHKEKPEVIRLMKSCNALIFPSIWYEGLPFTIIEAFATGTPVIASNLGAMADIIQHGYNGYHFEPQNSSDLISQIKAFEKNPLGTQMYANARESYMNRYHPDIHLQSVIDIYKKVIADHSAGNN